MQTLFPLQTLFKASRYLLPVAFFGYAVVVNVGYVNFSGFTDVPFDLKALKGSVTSNVDHVYKRALPHRDPAIGLIGAARYLVMGEGRKGVLAGRDNWLFTAEEARTMPQDLSAPLQQIIAVRDTLDREGVKLVIVPVPAKLDIYANLADQPDYSAAIHDRYSSFLTGLAAAGIAAVDSRAAMSAAALQSPVFLQTDTHWSQTGAAAVAIGLAQSGLIAQGDTDFQRVNAPQAQITGDLVSFVTSESLAPLLGFDPETVTPFLAEPILTTAAATDTGLSDLFGTAAAVDTVLVGTSYSANPNWSFAESLKIALHRDVLNFALEGQGPARPMLTYLASKDFADQPPTVVIWEFPVRYLSDPTIWDAEPAKDPASAT
ncbi:MAG: hypothetical protein WCC57_06510 [Paracoccaceae bacterium]